MGKHKNMRVTSSVCLKHYACGQRVVYFQSSSYFVSAGISDNFVLLCDQADAEVKNKNKVGFYIFRGVHSKT